MAEGSLDIKRPPLKKPSDKLRWLFKEYRKAHSLQEIATATGIGVNTIARFEHGQGRHSVLNLKNIARAVGFSGRLDGNG